MKKIIIISEHFITNQVNCVLNNSDHQISNLFSLIGHTAT